MTANTPIDQLDDYYQQVQSIILNKQDWVSGLLPASTAITVHGNYTDAWVRDNVYSILAAWGLALAYRRIGENEERIYILEQSTVKLMRGLLTAMMRQAAKVEKFKHTQNPLDALHAKYDTRTGGIVVGDHEWGHLQLDATSLFLLMLAQMIASGLKIVFTIDEVNFVQNLVHYISRTYRTPDYGIWERGNKINHGIAELNASSIGMAKAALEALSGFNLFGKNAGQASVIHVISDDIARIRITLESLLPRESLSKEIDSALLSVTGFPAFAIRNQKIKEKTEQLINQKLVGRFGCKRFLLDGHQTVIEDSHRLHYDPQELKQFMAIECEWPLFFCYLLLNKLFAGDEEAAADYRKKLENLLVEKDGQKLLPELYRVPKKLIELEKANPHSQDREANENIPLVWAQSLYILGCLVQDGLLTKEDIDPLARHKKPYHEYDYQLQVALLAQDETVQNSLQQHGIQAQTLAEVSPIQIREAHELAAAYTQIGRNDRIGLTGRPFRQLRTLATSKMYVLSGERLVFLPQCLNQKGFYLAMDNQLLIERLRIEFQYINKYWDRPGNPLVVISIKQNMLANHNVQVLIDFIAELNSGMSNKVPLTLGKLTDFVDTCNYEKINYLHDFEFSKAIWQEPERPWSQFLPLADIDNTPLSPYILNQWEIAEDSWLIEQLIKNSNLFAQLEALTLLSVRKGLDYPIKLPNANDKECVVRDLVEELYQRAGDQHQWYVVRRCAGLLSKYDINLEQAATDILVRQHLLTVGRAYSGKATLTRPVDSSELLDTIRIFNNNDASEFVIIQELILYLGMLIKSRPELFADMQTIRVGHLLQLILVRYKRECKVTLGEAFTGILSLPPHQLAIRVKETMEDYSNTENQLGQIESLHYEGECEDVRNARFSENMNPKDRANDEDWYDWRERQGSLGREKEAFFTSVWGILHHCQGLMMGEKINNKRRIDSTTTLSQMTSGEQSFKLYINHLLNKIQSPVYRQLTVEALTAIAFILRDSSIQIEDTLVTDIVIGHAVRIHWLQLHPQYHDNYEEHVAMAWQTFYHLPPYQVANSILDALLYLLNNK